MTGRRLLSIGASLLLVGCYGSVPSGVAPDTGSADTAPPPRDASAPDIGSPDTAGCEPGAGPQGPSTLVPNASCAEAPELPEVPGQVAASTRNRLIWKRVDTLQRDLGRALGAPTALKCDDVSYIAAALGGGLPFAELPTACFVQTSQELGQADEPTMSAFSLHRGALGGNDAFELGQYEPSEAPLATTPIAIDRAVMLACIRAVDEDPTGAITAAGIPLEATTDAAGDDTLDAGTTLFYRRLLARDPLDAELDAVRTLAVDDDDAAITVRDFLVLSCFVTGTTSEFLFY